MKKFLRRATVLLAAALLTSGSVTTTATAGTMATTAEGVRLVNGNSGFCMNIPGGSKEMYAPVTQFPCGTWADHYWTAEAWTDTLYILKNSNSKMCVSSNGSNRAGAVLVQDYCGGKPGMLWNLYIEGPNTRRFVSEDGMCIAVPGGSKEANVQLIQWPCGNWADHYWHISP